MNRLIEWFARNGVAANLLMVCIAFAGFSALQGKIRFEVWPTFESKFVTISMPYRGATPAEVEEAIVVRIEESIQDLEGIKEIVSTSGEGSGSVVVEAEPGYSARELLDDIKNRVDGITTFPDDTEQPVFSMGRTGGRVLTVMIAGDMLERELRRLGERVRDEITALPGVTQGVLKAVRPYEISIEVSERSLTRYGLTFDRISRAIRQSSLDLPAGGIKTRSGEILLRTKGQAYTGEDFERIVVWTEADGARVTLGDVATVRDDFEATPLFARFNGKPAVAIDVNHIGNQNAIEIGRTVKAYLEEAQARMPPGVELAYWSDRSVVVNSRLKTLANSATFGGILVFILLALLLRFALAFWVCVGIPISFLGALALMPIFGVSINILSLFAFILVLGIVVDDAIVTGENVFTHLQRGRSPVDAAVDGTKEVAIPVTFGVLTTIIAFLPLTMLAGRRGQAWGQIATIVILVLCFSLVESKLILPAHLKHCRNVGPDGHRRLNFLARLQYRIATGFENAITRFYRPILALSLRRRYLTMAIFVAMLLVTIGWIGGGRIRFTPFPRVASERIVMRLTMPLGSPEEITAGHIRRIEEAGLRLRDELAEEFGGDVINHIVATTGSQPFGSWGGGGGRIGRSHLGEVVLELVKPEFREASVDSMEVAKRLRQAVGTVPGAVSLSFRAHIGGSRGALKIQLTGSSFEDLESMAESLKRELIGYPGLFDISDSFEAGKEEIQLDIKPQAEHLDLTRTDLALQVRQAFFGQEVQRVQRGRDDIRVMLRYPEDERRSLHNLESMKIRTTDGVEVPFSEVAEARLGRSYASIRRVNRNRTIDVTADADQEVVELNEVRESLAAELLPALLAAHPGSGYQFTGEGQEQDETMGSLQRSVPFVLFAIYGMLAIAFRSYGQPLTVMLVIPVGLVGAVLGHLIMGMDLSMLSLFGMLALVGVVVNDSIVLVDYVNKRSAEGHSLEEAVRTAGVARFRPILLTSLTTFAGLIPLLAEKSTQAQFLKPMAVSLGFGVLFATFITLILVPANYLILADIRQGWNALYGKPEEARGTEWPT